MCSTPLNRRNVRKPFFENWTLMAYRSWVTKEQNPWVWGLWLIFLQLAQSTKFSTGWLIFLYPKRPFFRRQQSSSLGNCPPPLQPCGQMRAAKPGLTCPHRRGRWPGWGSWCRSQIFQTWTKEREHNWRRVSPGAASAEGKVCSRDTERALRPWTLSHVGPWATNTVPSRALVTCGITHRRQGTVGLQRTCGQLSSFSNPSWSHKVKAVSAAIYKQLVKFPTPILCRCPARHFTQFI